MRLTPDFCRIQAEQQRTLAASEILENRRAIALRAAKSWDEAAILADNILTNSGSPMDTLDAAITLEFAQEAEDELGNIVP